jgi:5'-3' exonuclease
MGIPSYFSYIIKNYSNIIRNLQYFTSQYEFRFHHLYMDCNSIIYDAVYSLDKQRKEENMSDVDFELAIINNVIKSINDYIALINPTETVFIAFDGVAPFAKMEQQRTRRYKSAFQSNISFENGEPKQTGWNTSAITPGTAFMEKLSNKIDYNFKHAEKHYNVKQMIVSCTNQPGEGEHKLFSKLREPAHINDTVAVYGLDSDLIMLSIFHLKYCKNIYIFREAPEFLKSSIPVKVRSNENEPHFLDIHHLAMSISSEMKCRCEDPQRIYDYVFLCFLLGNDFLPHFPAMNIRTHGINALLDIYRLCIGNHADRFFISKLNGKIQWKNVGIFISAIAKREHEFLMNEYYVRDKFDKRFYPETTAEEKQDFLLNIPTIYRGEEKYISPDEPMWESRYYKTLFNCNREPDKIKQICMNYLEGLEWTFKYYSNGCPSWKWKYNYHYPPLFVDLCKYIPHFEMDFINISQNNNKPFLPETQLSYVLAGQNLYLLPKQICQFLNTNYSELYPDNYKFQWAFCRYFWEAHPILPDISLELLEQWDIQYRLSQTSVKTV